MQSTIMLNTEQKHILHIASYMQAGEVLKIQAPAGSGKTFILLEIARQNPQSRFLYLAFNRAIVDEVRSKAPANVSVKTTHSLAYQHIVAKYYQGMQPRKEYTAFELGEILNKTEYFYLAKVKEALEDFFHSNQPSIDTSISEAHKDAHTLYEMMRQKAINFTHSFYLKEYQLLKSHQKQLGFYDYLLLDEAQDTNEVTLDIFLNTPNKKILVGDEHQGIYGFRGAFNAMEKLSCTHEQYLTYCFRTPQIFLDKATFFLNTFKKLKRPVVITEAITDSTRHPLSEAVITRTNAKIVELIAEDKIKGLRPLRNPDESFAMLLSLKHLSEKKKQEIRYPHLLYLKKFANIDKVQQYADDTGDTELKYSLNVLSKYKKDISDIYHRAKNLFEGQGNQLLLTTHTAKGLEFDKVMIANDFSDINYYHDEVSANSKSTPKDWQLFYEEINLYYVAITRTKKILIDDSPNDVFYQHCLEARAYSALHKGEA